METNWLNHCIPCGSWCCRDERPFASLEELNQLGVEKINIKTNGLCVFQDLGKCVVYDKRPFECRIYPFDIQEIDGSLFWVIWNTCLKMPTLNYEDILNKFESLTSIDYIHAYVKYHKMNQPEKYSEKLFDIIRKVQLRT